MSLSRLALIVSVKIYSWLIMIYPAIFRRQYGTEIIMLFSDMAKDGIRMGEFWERKGGKSIMND